MVMRLSTTLSRGYGYAVVRSVAIVLAYMYRCVLQHTQGYSRPSLGMNVPRRVTLNLTLNPKTHILGRNMPRR